MERPAEAPTQPYTFESSAREANEASSSGPATKTMAIANSCRLA